MPRFHPPLAAWLRTHHGIVSSRDLREMGISRGELQAMLACGELVAVAEGVYQHVLFPNTFLTTCAAVCAADATLVVTCGGAAKFWQFRRCAHIGLHVSGTGTGLMFIGGPVHHRCTIMPPDHVHQCEDGIRVTSPARTVFDLSKHLKLADLESVIEQGVRRSLFDIPTLYEVGGLLCRRGRAGSAQFAALLSSRPAWRRPADSHPEIKLRRALESVGVNLEPQIPLTLGDGHTVHPDLGDRMARFYIEIDDHEWHGGRLDSMYDHQRDRQARLVGARIERVSTDEIDAMPPSLITSLVAAYRQQRTLSLPTRGAC